MPISDISSTTHHTNKEQYMKYIDYFLKFDNEQHANQLLSNAEIIREVEVEDELFSMVPTEGVTIHTVGVIRKGGEWDSDGNVITAPTELEGWHVNLRLAFELSEEQQDVLKDAIVPTPSHPVAVFG